MLDERSLFVANGRRVSFPLSFTLSRDASGGGARDSGDLDGASAGMIGMEGGCVTLAGESGLAGLRRSKTLGVLLASADLHWTSMDRRIAPKLASESRGTQVSKPRENRSSWPSKPSVFLI
jgi:hypothetical protein